VLDGELDLLQVKVNWGHEEERQRKEKKIGGRWGGGVHAALNSTGRACSAANVRRGIRWLRVDLCEKRENEAREEGQRLL
jgi:hypothetical protein